MAAKRNHLGLRRTRPSLSHGADSEGRGIPSGIPTTSHVSRPTGILQVMRVRDRLTSATATLMQRHGVVGTGIAEILATSGVTRRSIYLNFPGGKAELVAAATRSAGDELTALLRDCIQK